MFDSLGVDSSLSTFHNAVEKLYNEQPKSIFASIYRRIISWVTGESSQPINQQITDITAQAEKILRVLPEEMQNMESLQNKLGNKDFKDVKAGNSVISREELQQFCADMDRLFQGIYPLADISPFSTTKKMPKLVQEYFSADIKDLRKEKAMNPAMVNDDAHRTRRKIAKGKHAIALGSGIKKNTGSTGTLIIQDINGKPVGIHKVSSHDVPLLTRINNYLKVFIGGQLSCLSNSDFAQPMAERASYILSKGLDFNLAPPSKKEVLNGVDGVFQIFISKEKNRGVPEEVKEAQNIVVEHAKNNPDDKGPNEYREAADIFTIIESKKIFTEKEMTLFQKLAIFDFLIGNLDRHEENWLVTLSDKNEITNIKAIDNANAFPKVQPEKGTTASQHQYEWKSLKIAGRQFTPEVVEFVKNWITLNNLKNNVTEIQSECGDFLDPEMEELLYIRQKVIYKLVCEEKGKTPADLASYSTKDEMLTFCLPNNAYNIWT